MRPMSQQQSSLDLLRIKAKFFRGLGDINRLRILELLVSGPKNVSEIVELTGLSQPNVSAHLRCLRDCHLVKTRKLGRKTFYELADPLIAELLEKSDHVIQLVYREIYACVNYEEDFE